MIRPLIMGAWPGEQRARVDLTREQIMALPRATSWGKETSAPHGATFLVEDRHDWRSGRWLLLQATVIRGPWKYGGRGAGDRVPCHPQDPERFTPRTEREATTEGDADYSVGYALIWSECPALDRLEAIVAERRAR